MSGRLQRRTRDRRNRPKVVITKMVRDYNAKEADIHTYFISGTILGAPKGTEITFRYRNNGQSVIRKLENKDSEENLCFVFGFICDGRHVCLEIFSQTDVFVGTMVGDIKDKAELRMKLNRNTLPTPHSFIKEKSAMTEKPLEEITEAKKPEIQTIDSSEEVSIALGPNPVKPKPEKEKTGWFRRRKDKNSDLDTVQEPDNTQVKEKKPEYAMVPYDYKRPGLLQKFSRLFSRVPGTQPEPNTSIQDDLVIIKDKLSTVDRIEKRLRELDQIAKSIQEREAELRNFEKTIDNKLSLLSIQMVNEWFLIRDQIKEHMDKRTEDLTKLLKSAMIDAVLKSKLEPVAGATARPEESMSETKDPSVAGAADQTEDDANTALGLGTNLLPSQPEAAPEEALEPETEVVAEAAPVITSWTDGPSENDTPPIGVQPLSKSELAALTEVTSLAAEEDEETANNTPVEPETEAVAETAPAAQPEVEPEAVAQPEVAKLPADSYNHKTKAITDAYRRQEAPFQEPDQVAQPPVVSFQLDKTHYISALVGAAIALLTVGLIFIGNNQQKVNSPSPVVAETENTINVNCRPYDPLDLGRNKVPFIGVNGQYEGWTMAICNGKRAVVRPNVDLQNANSFRKSDIAIDNNS